LPLEARLALGLTVALAIVYAATPIAIRVAARLEFYDRPIGYKGHRQPTPYLGGAAVMTGFLLAVIVLSTDDRGRTLPLLGGMLVLWAVGTLDDRHNLSPGLRLAVEAVLAWMLWATGLGWDLGLGGGVDLALTVLWVLAVVNAFNLFDNMDGAASTMALVVSAGVAIMGLVQHDTWLALAGAALCGACLGFLPHNLATPARIFLGDGGSMPIGFGVAALVMVGSAEAVPAWQALVVGLLLVGVPALDTALVMISRRRRRISILTGGRDHLTHRTQRSLRTARAVAIGLGAIQALVSALALFAIKGGVASVALVIVLYVVVAATAIALLEAAERELETVSISPGTAVAVTPRSPVRPWLGIAAVVLLGLGLGTNAFAGGWYDQGKWIPIGVGLLVVATAAAIARPPRLTRSALLCLGGLVGLAFWALISSAWAPSIVQATTEGNRLFVLAAIFATALVLVRTDKRAAWLTGGLLAGIGAVAVYVLANLLGSNPAALFGAGRLNQPLGYINGQATVFMMGFWLCFAVAERRPVWLAGLGIGGATLMGCLGLLTQSRGAVLAIAASAVVVVALVPGDRLKRVYGLIACAIGVAAVAGPLIHVYDVGVTRAVPDGIAHTAGLAIIGTAVLTGAIWATALAVVPLATDAAPRAGVMVRRAGVALLAVAAIAIVGVGLASAGRIADQVSTQWTAFTNLGDTSVVPQSTSSSRLVSGAGTRYDYWRIALDAFADHPLEGVGAGNYDRPYFRARKTTEDIRQPHSFELQELAELGLVGGALVACFIVGLVLGAVRMRSAAAASPLAATLMVGAVGVVTAWLVQTSVDWIHLMPGLTGVALAMAAVLALNRAPAEAVSREPSRTGRLALRPAALASATLAGLALVVGAASLSRQGLADFFRHRADAALADDPADAIKEANRSLRLDAENPSTYYIKAAALARFDEAGASRNTLVQALRKEPDDFVTWTLMGDLAVRRGRFDEAKRNYSRASALNPVDASLRDLARDPRSALPAETP
jgi:UDP-N-acetylmuramyl pentapeptide phosphotransferase/UDP-N-acetylglucosamine-1-phosphate transferase